jgi:predicted metal-dependent RNase
LKCGLFHHRRAKSIERNRNFHFDPKQINAVVLSHAQTDHCGNVPNLCRQGFEGNTHSTFATHDLASIMFEDSTHEVAPRLASLDSSSGYADKNELRRYVETIFGDIKKIAVVHGEEDQALAFAEMLRGMQPSAEAWCRFTSKPWRSDRSAC